MKAVKVLLRWYKSFNVNYTQYVDQGLKTPSRPWNTLLLDGATESDLPFIEIPLESDVTTIVGANESGKSHLLSAISKIITGSGLPDLKHQPKPFSRTDLCHYSSRRSKNADAWPQIGLMFSELASADVQLLKAAIDEITWQPGATFTFILAPRPGGPDGYIYYSDNETPYPLDSAKIEAIRKCFPEVHFIQSSAELSDEVYIADVLSHFATDTATNGATPVYSYTQLFNVAQAILGLQIGSDNQIPPDRVAPLRSAREALTQRDRKNLSGQLEAELFRVLEIDSAAIEYLARLHDGDRSYAESLVETWNDEIEDTLNLSRYWQQDDQFRIRLNYKRGILYFEITDKTNAVYTFGERSSGLKYFLSYYIQAKAIQHTAHGEGCIILMDEPDSYLSIAGQRNLLAVFESLVSADSSLRNAQLLYTTHSPFLINRNFPRRIRLVRKGDAEEGTQYVGAPHVRRYEPIRSALGIDCAQMLFMGATNVIVEGTTDQYLLSELVRYFATPENISELLDLNAVIVTSCDGAGGAEQLLTSSDWGDEPRPASLVILDDDTAGHTARERITGVEKNCKQLIHPDFVMLISEGIPGTAIDSRQVVTTEDLLPLQVYAEAIRQYLRRWHRVELDPEAEETISSGEFGKAGIVADAKALFRRLTGTDQDYDKMGVLREAIRVLQSTPGPGVEELRKRFFNLCETVRYKLDRAERAQQLSSRKQGIRRLIREFLVIHRESAPLFDIGILIDRLEREVDGIGDDGTQLVGLLGQWRDEIQEMRSAGQKRPSDDGWRDWVRRFESMKRDPFGQEKSLSADTADAADVRASAAAGQVESGK